MEIQSHDNHAVRPNRIANPLCKFPIRIMKMLSHHRPVIAQIDRIDGARAP